MNLKKTIFIIFASCGLVLPSLQAAEYSQSFSGNVRVQSLSSTETKTTAGKETTIETLTTDFGGEDEESSTGGDTYLQWNHKFTSDDGNTEGTGFLRFAADKAIRYNVEASSQLGDYHAALKAEWQTADGFSGALSGRDQFAVLTHSPTGVYYKIGREEWLSNEKGYTTDFLSATKDYSSQQANARFSLHALGWKGSGAHIALLIQRDSVGSDQSDIASGSLFGDSQLAGPNFNTYGEEKTETTVNTTNPDGTSTVTDVVTEREVVTGQTRQATDTNGLGLRLGYTQGAVDAELTFLSGSQNTNKDRRGAEIEGTAAVTQLYLAFPIQDGKFKPFLNFGTQTRERTASAADGSPELPLLDYSRSGWNLGVSLGLGASDLVLAYGSLTETNGKVVNGADGERLTDLVDEDTTSSGFDLMWATNQDPLKVSLAYTSGSLDTVGATGANPTTTGKYGVRLEYGF